MTPLTTIRTEGSAPFVWVVMDGETRRNALGSTALSALCDAIAGLVADPEVRAIGLRGQAGHFCAGADITELTTLDSPSAAREHARMGQAACNAVEQAPVPVIAAVRGYCVGGGLELAMSCDMRLAHPQARLGQVELGIGSIAAWGGIRRLPRLVGVAAAKDLVYTGRYVGATEALRLGLITEVVDDGDVEAAAEALGRRLGEAPRLALAASKRAIDHWADVPLAAGLEDDRETFARLMEGEEFQAGISRFLGRSER